MSEPNERAPISEGCEESEPEAHPLQAVNALAPRDYESIKRLAKLTGRNVRDYLVLAPQNDPFYMGVPSNRRDGKWFADVYRDFSIARGAHIRRIHYAISSGNNPPQMPDQQTYTNTNECWEFVGKASKAARYLGYVDPEAFEDRKNPPAMIYRPDPFTPAGGLTLTDAELSHLDILPGELDLPRLLAPSFRPLQRYHLEIWCEKTTANDVLIPLGDEYEANIITGAGELTLTAVIKFLQRCRSGYPARLFYVSDFDPAGKTMPVSIARKIEFLLKDRPDLDVRVYPIVLTAEQCTSLNLPRIPIKDSERRKEKFETIHGAGATELDALEAVHPGKLREIISGELRRYFDRGLIHECDQSYMEYQAYLDGECKRVYDAHRSDIAAVQGEYGKALQTLRAIAPKAAGLWQAIRAEIEQIELHPEVVPQAVTVYHEPVAMFDSRRDPEEQLEAYKLFQEGRL